MHILIIPSELYIPAKSPLSGIFQYHHAQLLKDYGVKVGVVSAAFIPFQYNFKSYPYPKKEVSEGTIIYRLFKRIYIPGRFGLDFLNKQLVSWYVKLYEAYIIENGLPDVIHAHNSLFAGMAALRIKEKYGIKYIITEHSSLYERNLISRSHLAIAKQVLEHADAITVVSTKLGKSLVNKFGQIAERFIPIFNVLESEFANEKPQNSSSIKSDDSVFILSIGSIDENKNHMSLLTAFAEKFKGNHKVKLTIGGDGPILPNLIERSEDLKISEQVVFTGPLSREEVKNEMMKCDIFVLPSIVETFGVVLIEALALGKPVISTFSGGPEDIVSEVNGLLVPVKDDAALGNALTKMVGNLHTYSPEKIKEDCLNKFGRDAFFQRLEKIYTDVITK